MDDRNPLRMPPLNILAATTAPREWAALPTRAKVLHALADQAGLKVFYCAAELEFHGETAQGWMWSGTEAQFRASGLFNPSTNWGFVRWGSATTPEGLAVDLLRPETPGQILAVHTRYDIAGRRSCGRLADMALHDHAYLRFRCLALTPVAGIELEATPPPPAAPAPANWQGDIPCRITPMIRESYVQRGVFPMLVKDVRGPYVVRVSRDVAEEVQEDAWQGYRRSRSGGKANAWRQLRNGLWEALQQPQR